MRCSRPTRLTARRKSTRRWRSPWPIPATCSNSSLPFRSKSGSRIFFLRPFGTCAAFLGMLSDLRQSVRIFGAQIREVMLSHTTQTNEPARCAVLLPLLAQLPQPLALLEVGASAGLCLLPDHYGYDYGHTRLAPAVSGDDRCAGVRLQRFRPRSRYRKRSLASRGALDWTSILSTCDRSMIRHGSRPSSGPGRMRGQRSCVPPSTLRGAIRRRWSGVICGRISRGWRQRHRDDATLVVFHTAVLGYVLPPIGTRSSLPQPVSKAGAEWISNEAPRRLSFHRRAGAAFARNGAVSACTEWHTGRVDRAAWTVARLVRCDVMVATKCRDGSGQACSRPSMNCFSRGAHLWASRPEAEWP